MPISNRKFGVEIECFGAEKDQIIEVFSNLDIGCHVDFWHDDHSYDSWKISKDGSVVNNQGRDGDCWEIISPPLSGEDGLENIAKVCKALKQIGIKVNKTCGLHVHVDAENLSSIDFANIAMRYAKFEENIDSFMPVSRRNNESCRNMRGVSDRIRNLNNIAGRSVKDFIFSVGHGRYLKLNLMSFPRHGTIEFRQHSGSVNHTKITNWIRFCVNFVERSRVTEDNYCEEVVCRAKAIDRTIHYRAYSLTPHISKIVDALNDNVVNGDGKGCTSEYLAWLVGFVGFTTNEEAALIRDDIAYIRQVYSIGPRTLFLNLLTGKYMFENSAHVLENSFESSVAGETRTLVADGSAETQQNYGGVSAIRTSYWNFLEGDTWSRGLDDEIVSFYNERTARLSAT